MAETPDPATMEHPPGWEDAVPDGPPIAGTEPALPTASPEQVEFARLTERLWESEQVIAALRERCHTLHVSLAIAQNR